ncbi:histone deacetylase family protein [Maritimibacter sp. DP1N21-5]|uniref:histone deacetylase family protein n=1 Tax=Maritimibacter sp. DP1N21-5 TaxID=2836867 RepID=UPI001C448CA0|nr:histone deacetylase family protein [Maritimibacter sp. DP1N21-5]MBV7410895.1 histone deacetylase family protein [Maritimibacter sp. DP1N21-5]
MTTALFYHDDCLDHVNPPGHPEQVARLDRIREALANPDYAPLDRREAPICDDASILLAHPQSHISALEQAAPEQGFSQIDPDTGMSLGSLIAARRAVGANVAAVDAVLSGDVTNAFVACRPPGHHAEKTRAMGFCLFSNVAIAALHAIRNHGLSRVAVLDFDVHHGNGTQDVLWDVPEVRFVSSHQMPLYPGTGAPQERGAHGQIMNAPLGPGTGGEDMRLLWGNRVIPWIEDWEPELILVSAGFDAHRDDPLANLNWTTEDFGWLTDKLCALATRCCKGRVVSTLEGGYDLDALAESASLHVKTLMEHGA